MDEIQNKSSDYASNTNAKRTWKGIACKQNESGSQSGIKISWCHISCTLYWYNSIVRKIAKNKQTLYQTFGNHFAQTKGLSNYVRKSQSGSQREKISWFYIFLHFVILIL